MCKSSSAVIVHILLHGLVFFMSVIVVIVSFISKFYNVACNVKIQYIMGV